jgi:hypothetical protein
MTYLSVHLGQIAMEQLFISVGTSWIIISLNITVLKIVATESAYLNALVRSQIVNPLKPLRECDVKNAQ